MRVFSRTKKNACGKHIDHGVLGGTLKPRKYLKITRCMLPKSWDVFFLTPTKHRRHADWAHQAHKHIANQCERIIMYLKPILWARDPDPGYSWSYGLFFGGETSFSILSIWTIFTTVHQRPMPVAWALLIWWDGYIWVWWSSVWIRYTVPPCHRPTELCNLPRSPPGKLECSL